MLTAAVVLVISTLLVKMFVFNNHEVGDEVSASVDIIDISPKKFYDEPQVKLVKAVTWNIAAVNNNPFEYWITSDDPKYNELMVNVSQFIETPGGKDVPVADVFSDEMFEELMQAMAAVGWTGLEETRKYWEEDYKHRKVISEFVKDDLIGKKVTPRCFNHLRFILSECSI